MASIAGARYAFFSQEERVNVVYTADGSNLPVARHGEFNLEVILSLTATPTVPSGYQGVALMSPDGSTLELATGNYGARDTIGGAAVETIIGGTGNDTIDGGRSADWIVGGAGSDVINGGGDGGDTILGGAGAATIQGMGHDSILGGSGPSTVDGGRGDTIVGGSGAMSVNGRAGSEQIRAGSGADTIVAANKDVVMGGTGNAKIDLGGGPTTVNLGSGAANIADTGVRSSATVTGFDQLAGDSLSFAGETSRSIAHVVATAITHGDNTTLAFPDGTEMTLIGITHVNATFFK